MSIFSRLKLKKKTAQEKKILEEKPQAVKQTKKKAKTIKPLEKQEFSETAVRVLIAPHITERATELGERGKYTFRVKKGAKKPQIKKAIQEMYGVNVVSVNIINVPKKRRRLGRTEGYRSGYKKAIVSLSEGQKIEVMPR